MSSTGMIVFVSRVCRCVHPGGEFLWIGLARLVVEAALGRCRLGRLRRGALSRQGRLEIAQTRFTRLDTRLGLREFIPGFFKRGFLLLDRKHSPGFFFSLLF